MPKHYTHPNANSMSINSRIIWFSHSFQHPFWILSSTRNWKLVTSILMKVTSCSTLTGVTTLPGDMTRLLLTFLLLATNPRECWLRIPLVYCTMQQSCSHLSVHTSADFGHLHEDTPHGQHIFLSCWNDFSSCCCCRPCCGDLAFLDAVYLAFAYTQNAGGSCFLPRGRLRDHISATW